jgi:hypothetical protein
MAEESLNAPAEPPISVELQTLVQRAQAGDATALPRLREILDGHPEIWQHVGDLTALTERVWITVLAADHPLAVESMKRTVAQMKAELVGDHPTRLERMLVDQVVACWMEVNYLEGAAADQRGGSLEQAAFRLKRLESAQKRYLNAIKMLTETRTLMPRALAPAQSVKLFEESRRERA